MFPAEVPNTTIEGPMSLEAVFALWRQGCLSGAVAPTQPISPNSVIPRVVVKPQTAVNYADPAKIAVRNRIITDTWQARMSAAGSSARSQAPDKGSASVRNIFQSIKRKAAFPKTPDQPMLVDQPSPLPPVSESSAAVQLTEPINLINTAMHNRDNSTSSTEVASGASARSLTTELQDILASVHGK